MSHDLQPADLLGEEVEVEIRKGDMVWRVVGVPVDAELTAELVETDDSYAPMIRDVGRRRVKREFVLRLVNVTYEAEGGAPRLVP